MSTASNSNDRLLALVAVFAQQSRTAVTATNARPGEFDDRYEDTPEAIALEDACGVLATP